jgi:hypothetical protein
MTRSQKFRWIFFAATSLQLIFWQPDGAVGILLDKLCGIAWKPPSGAFFHPLVLLFPLSAALLHFQLFDGRLFPHSSWPHASQESSCGPGGNAVINQGKFKSCGPHADWLIEG